MFRSDSSSSGSSGLEGNTPSDLSAFHGMGGLNMYLESSSQNMSPSVSSVTLSPPTTPLAPEPSISTTRFPLLADNNHVNMNAASTAGTLFLQRQYQYHLQLQQQQQQIAYAQHQLVLAASAAAANHHQKDEIAHSLKMFALLTACSTDNGTGSTQDAMQEFAANGYVSDEFNRFQYNNQSSPTPHPPQLACQYPTSSTGVGNSTTAAATMPPALVTAAAAATVPPALAAAAASVPPALAAAHWISLNNYREQLNNVWRSISMPYVPNIAANTGFAIASANQKNVNNMGLAMPSDHVRNISNVNIINNKIHKRYNNGKSKDQVTRPCVFCENNNEPEAVVNSHSVRDSYGRVLCPKLRTYVCPICGASGDSAHTIKYCPKKPIVTMEDAIKAESFRLAKSNYYKQQMKV